MFQLDLSLKHIYNQAVVVRIDKVFSIPILRQPKRPICHPTGTVEDITAVCLDFDGLKTMHLTRNDRKFYRGAPVAMMIQ